MSKPRIADLFCGAGGAAKGLHRAGFEVVGFDIAPQKNYPFEFHQQDALTVDLSGFDAVWASPPCQGYSILQNSYNAKSHPDMIPATRLALNNSGLSFIIENVERAPLLNAITLCGSMFETLMVRRHRLFESNKFIKPPSRCRHQYLKLQYPIYEQYHWRLSKYVPVFGARGKDKCGHLWEKAMGIDWMTTQELTQAVPPAYSEYLGKQLMESLKMTTEIQTIPTLHSLWNYIRDCEACPLRKGCLGPCPGIGPENARVMFIGEAPGRNEDREGFPFVGQAGDYLDSLLSSIGVERSEVYITNVVKCRPSNTNRDPKPEEISVCTSHNLEKELLMVRPEIIVTLGRFASWYILGTEDENMEEMHAQPKFNVEIDTTSPVEVTGEDGAESGLIFPPLTIPIVLPIFHPAAALHNPYTIPAIQEGFKALSHILAGNDPKLLLKTDPFAGWEDYLELSEPEEIFNYLQAGAEIAMDTEYIPGEDNEDGKPILVSIQLSDKPGTAVYIAAENWYHYVDWQAARLLPVWPPGTTIIVHNYPADAESLGWDKNPSLAPSQFADTIQMAYALSLPLGLKTLAAQLCGMKMHSFGDMVGPIQEQMAEDYTRLAVRSSLVSASPPKANMFKGKGSRKVFLAAKEAYAEYLISDAAPQPYSDPEPIREYKWDNKKSALSEKVINPQNIGKKLARIVKDFDSGKIASFWKRLNDIPESQFEPVTERHGDVPIANIKDVPFDVSMPYAARDADATLRVYYELLHRVRDFDLKAPPTMNSSEAEMEAMGVQSLEAVINDHDIGTLPVVLEMMRSGMGIDPHHFKTLSREFAERMKDEAYACSVEAGKLLTGQNVPTKFEIGSAGEPLFAFNPNSSVQVVELLFVKLAYPPTAISKDSGLPTVDERHLKILAAGFTDAPGFPNVKPLTDHIIAYRKLLKLKTTYADPLPGFARTEIEQPEEDLVYNASHRVHCSIRTTSTDTGRLSTSLPNLMAIPVRTKDGSRIREGFVAEPHSNLGPTSFLAIDYSQIEVRVMAHVAQVKNLLDIYARDGDVHTETTMKLLDIHDPTSQLVIDTRRSSKIMSFGVMYGMTPPGLLESLIQEDIPGWDLPRCEEFYSDYFQLNPEIKAFQQATIGYARRHGFVRDMHGRMRLIPELSVPVRSVQSQGARQAINQPIQSGAQGIIKLAMRNIWNKYPVLFRGADPIIKWILQVHDELIWEVPNTMIASIGEQFREDMERAYTLSVPVIAEVSTGATWAAVKE